MRQAIVEIVGMLIIDLAREDSPDTDTKKQQKQINGLFAVLFERVLDLSPYVRSKVFNVFSKIADVEKPRFPRQRLSITSFAVSALDDKSASVRKAAASLLGQLMFTHPYFVTHGGSLQREAFAKDYKEASDELAKIESVIGNAVNNEDNEHAEGDSPRKKNKKYVKLRYVCQYLVGFDTM